MFRFIRDRFRPTLALKLGFLVLASTGLIFLLAVGYSSHIARNLLMKAAEGNTRNLARSTVHRIESVLLSVEPLTHVMALRLERAHPDRQSLLGMLHDMLHASPPIYGSAVAFAPGEFSDKVKAFAPYLYRESGSTQAFSFVDLGQGDYDYFSSDWYLIPRETAQAGWSEPYYDEGGGNALMCTYSVPFYRETNGQRRFAGVITADLRLDRLVKIVAGIKLYQSGYAFLISRNGRFISHPNPKLVFKESLFSLAEERKDPALRTIGRQMVRGHEGFVRFRDPETGRPSWLYYAPVSASGWSMGIVIPEAEVLADLRAMNRVVEWIGGLGFGLLLIVIALLSTSVTRPIRTLARQTHEIARGNLDLPVPPLKSRDEVGDLSHSFEGMRLALKDYIANLADTTAAKERIESELKIAQNIQRSFLPKRFPPFPERTEFDIYAELLPAKEVGGDLYDFFLLDSRRLFFTIGDVSGKGVPAALFMAVSKTLIKGVAEQHLSPSQVLTKVNHELYVDNEQMMFVTVFCGILDLETGELQYTNAGHLPPLLFRGPRGNAWVELPKGVLLGISENPVYETRTLTLGPQDVLVLYTDGVTEAMNPGQELYGEERLWAWGEGHSGVSPKGLVEGLIGSIQQFAGGEPQSDDITVVALQYRAKRESIGT